MKYIYTYDLHKLLKEELKNGSSDLVTRPSGQVVRNRIESDIEKEEDSFFKFPIGN
jgi:predicted DNA-binding protein